MTTPWVPRRSYLRVFAISLLMVFLALIVFLFAVHLEAIAPASAVIHGRDEQTVRAQNAGLIELGWHEGQVQRSGQAVRVRLDAEGNGTTDPGQGASQLIEKHKTADGQEVRAEQLRFHRLETGDILWPGQVLARVRPEPVEKQLLPTHVRAPDNRHWLVLKVYASPGEPVKPGDAIALITPIDPKTKEPLDAVAYLEIQEKHAGEVKPGQRVRIYSTMFNQRLHGHAEGILERLEPLGEAGDNGERKFRGVASITSSPFPLRLGSSAKVEIVIGPKRVYSIILEQ